MEDAKYIADHGPDYEHLVGIGRSLGEQRHALLEAPNVRRAAILKHTNLVGYVALVAGLRGWSLLPEFKRAVSAKLTKLQKANRSAKAAADRERKVAEARHEGRTIVDGSRPADTAETFLNNSMPHLVYCDGTFLRYLGGYYVAIEEREVRAAIQHFLVACVDTCTGERYRSNRRSIDDLLDAVKSIVLRNDRAAPPPTWFEHSEGDPDPRNVVVCRNGIVDLAAQQLLPHTPRLFTRNAVSFEFEDPVLSDRPHAWLDFLQQVWPGNSGAESIDALQEIMGYLLTLRTEYQKIFMLVGPPASGKGTITRVITDLLGERNVATQSVDNLGRTFGLKPLLGKQVAFVTDLRLGKDANIGGITETLLNISGEDRVSVNRKFQDEVQLQLSAKIVLMSNLPLALPDQAGALNRRLYPLVMRRSFAGREDTNLLARLRLELPQIFNWALQGLRRLDSRLDPGTGRKLGFVLTTDGREMLGEIAKRGSSVKAFVDARCQLGEQLAVPKYALFQAFEAFCEEEDLDFRHRPESFARELFVATARQVKSSRLRVASGERQ